MTNVVRKTKTVVGCGLLAMLTACNGILDDIYDAPATPAAGDIYIDASDWTEWHYIDLHALKEAADKGEMPEQVYTTYGIPLEKTDRYDQDSTGIFTYWYDVFGEGISNNEFRESYPTVPQPEPEHWDLAFHRNNVRTNGGAALETSITDISQVGSHSVFATLDFVGDTWNQMDVWTVQDRMLQGIVGNQRIKINTELGKWLRLDIPPMPPAFTHNSNVFVVRLADGTYAAIRLKNYIGTSNRKCQLTIEYKYPI